MSNDNSKINSATDLDIFKAKILEHIRAGKPLNGKDGVLTPLIKEVMNAALEGEMEAHLENEAQLDVINRRNGKMTKTIKSGSGEFELITPRDRNGSFEPQLVKKRQTILTDELDDKILKLFAIGTSYKDIATHLSDMYGVDLSTATISAVTDKLLPLIMQWRNRPLESIYPVIFLDAMFFKARENGNVYSDPKKLKEYTDQMDRHRIVANTMAAPYHPVTADHSLSYTERQLNDTFYIQLNTYVDNFWNHSIIPDYTSVKPKKQANKRKK